MKGRDADPSDDHGFGESSRYAAHLDRGWAMLDRGNPAAARTSAEHAQEARPDDPDAIVLLGAVALAESNPEESLRCYERAIELDHEYLEPYLAAARVCLYDLDDATRGLRYCTDALELERLTPFESLDVHLVAAESELAAHMEGAARQRLASLDEESILMSTLRLGARPDLLEEVDDGDPDDEQTVASAFLRKDIDGDELDDEERVDRIGRALQLAFGLARMRLDLGEPDAAVTTLRELLRWYPGEPDAWYLLSEAHHRAGRLPEACVAALKTLELDHEGEVADWVPSYGVIHRRVVQFLKDCPESAMRSLIEQNRPLTVMVRDAPAPELVMEGVDPRVAVLALAGRPGLEGAPLPARAELPPPQLTGLAIYRRNLARFARDPDHYEQELRFAVLDELAVFMGLGNPDRERLGLPPLAQLEPPPEPPPPEDPDPEEGKRGRKRGRRRRSRAAN